MVQHSGYSRRIMCSGLELAKSKDAHDAHETFPTHSSTLTTALSAHQSARVLLYAGRMLTREFSLTAHLGRVTLTKAKHLVARISPPQKIAWFVLFLLICCYFFLPLKRSRWVWHVAWDSIYPSVVTLANFYLVRLRTEKSWKEQLMHKTKLFSLECFVVIGTGHVTIYRHFGIYFCEAVHYN